MADFGGIQIKTPQEVMAQLAQQREAAATLPPRQARNLMVQQGIANMFGNPELMKAREMESRMQSANSVFEKMKTGNPLDDEQSRLTAMYDAVKDVDPIVASQIQSKLTELDSERFERERLKAADARAQRNLEINEQNAAIAEARAKRAAKWDDFAFAVDKQGGVSTYDLTNPERNAAYNAAVEAGATPLDQDQAAQMLTIQQRARLAADELLGDLSKDKLNKSEFAKVTNRYRADMEYMDRATKLMNLLHANAGAATDVASINNLISGLAQEGKTFLGTIASPDGRFLNIPATQKYIDEKLSRMEDLTLPDGMTSAQFKSAILNMGYVLARSLDSGGRLSDQDVNMAIEMLTGNSVNPKTITSILLAQGKNKVDMLGGMDEVLFSEEMADAGNYQATVIRGASDKVRSQYVTMLNTAAKNLDEVEMNSILNPEEVLDVGPPVDPEDDGKIIKTGGDKKFNTEKVKDTATNVIDSYLRGAYPWVYGDR